MSNPIFCLKTENCLSAATNFYAAKKMGLKRRESLVIFFQQYRTMRLRLYSTLDKNFLRHIQYFPQKTGFDISCKLAPLGRT